MMTKRQHTVFNLRLLRLARLAGAWVMLFAIGAVMTDRSVTARATPQRLADNGWIEEKSVADGDLWVRWFDSRSTVEVKLKGSLELTRDERDIRAISPNGQLLIREQMGASNVLFEARPGSSRYLIRRFVTEGGSGQRESAWLARVLPDLLRNTGVNADTRVRRLYQRGGVYRVLREIPLIRSDRVKSIYYQELLKGRALSTAAQRRVMRQAGKEIASDGEKASFLVETAATYVRREDRATGAYFKTLESVSSEEELERVLLALIERKDLPRTSLLRVIRAAGNISSDDVKGTLLLRSIDAPAADGIVVSALLNQVKEISADELQGRLLLAVLDRAELSQSTLKRIELLAKEEITSDASQQEVLEKLDRWKSSKSRSSLR